MGVKVALEVYNTRKGIKNKHQNLIIGLGNFDGVHLGHQRLIGGLVSEARALAGHTAVLTFDPSTRLQVTVWKSSQNCSCRGRSRENISRLGVKVLLVYTFSTEFAALSAGGVY